MQKHAELVTILNPPARRTASSRRGFLTAIGSAVGAICAGLVQTSHGSAGQSARTDHAAPAISGLAPSATHAPGTTTYSYDLHGRLISVVDIPAHRLHPS